MFRAQNRIPEAPEKNKKILKKNKNPGKRLLEGLQNSCIGGYGKKPAK